MALLVNPGFPARKGELAGTLVGLGLYARWETAGRSLQCNTVNSCFLSKHFAANVGAPLVGALAIPGLIPAFEGTHQGCPYICLRLCPAALRPQLFQTPQGFVERGVFLTEGKAHLLRSGGRITIEAAAGDNAHADFLH